MNNHTIILLLAATFCTAIAALLCARLFKQPATSHNRSHQLDGLRGVLACAVIAHHFYYNFTWREGGNWGASQTLIQNLGAVSVSLLLAIWFGFVAHGYSFANLLNYRGLTKLGDLSYAIYLLHGMVIFMWFGVWKMFAFRQGDFVGYVIHLPLIFAAAIGLAYLGNRYIEMPFARKRK